MPFRQRPSFHIYGEALRAAPASTWCNAPYKGEALQMTDLIGGTVSSPSPIGTALPHLKSGRIRALALWARCA